ncbi:hypothetical protein AB0J72_48705 [Dactylosporangium sp. NPDC049742]|uniref:hypothetical protein n=1 Tax=Dactylosporangium sp. NPDC049742 TaxID=3154737 RepID=UPI003429563C
MSVEEKPVKVPTALIGCQVRPTLIAQFESWHLSGHGVDNMVVGPAAHADRQQPD